MWEKKGIKGKWKGKYMHRAKLRELRLINEKGEIKEYPSCVAAKKAGWVYKA